MNKKRRLMPITLDSYKPLREIVFESLRDAILNQTLEPGERLMEIQLAEEMGVSRTPVREAIRKLELEGLVVMVPRKGVYVAGISIRDIHEVFEVRASLEGLAARLAAQRITPDELDLMERSLFIEAGEIDKDDLGNIVKTDTDFHELLYKAARNLRLYQMVNNLQEQLLRFRSTSLARPGRSKDALDEHRKILEALALGDSKLAEKLAIEHIENAETVMMASIESQGLYQDQESDQE